MKGAGSEPRVMALWASRLGAAKASAHRRAVATACVGEKRI